MTRVGLCGFTIGAERYFERFPVVEVQQTFYEPPALTTLQRWRAAAPPSFEFTMKAWQVITHLASSRTYRRLKSPLSDQERKECGAFQPTPTVHAAWEKTLRCARLLRATSILFQCPASFRPEPQNIQNMRSFLESIDRSDGLTCLWEPRGAWPDELIRDLCGELALVHAVDPFIRPSLTPELTYWRLHGNGSHYASYSDDELRKMVEWLRGSSEAYVMFNNIPRPTDADRFMKLLPI